MSASPTVFPYLCTSLLKVSVPDLLGGSAPSETISLLIQGVRTLLEAEGVLCAPEGTDNQHFFFPANKLWIFFLNLRPDFPFYLV